MPNMTPLEDHSHWWKYLTSSLLYKGFWWIQKHDYVYIKMSSNWKYYNCNTHFFFKADGLIHSDCLIVWLRNLVFLISKFVLQWSDHALDHTWPYNEELKSISRHLTQESMTKICQKLKIDCKYNNNDDEGKRFDSLREWRNKVAEKSVKKKHEQLSSALESNNLKGNAFLIHSLCSHFSILLNQLKQINVADF